MAIVFAQQKKKQKVLVFILVASLLVTAAVLWFGFREQKTGLEAYIEGNPEVSQEEININFDVLKNPLLKDLQFFPEIQPLEQGSSTGRENPFLPY